MVADASIESGSHIRKDVFYSIVKLYVRVRAFLQGCDSEVQTSDKTD